MTDGRVEHIARSLCRVAGYDPDMIVEPKTPLASFHARAGLANGPAWLRFRKTAEDHCRLAEMLRDAT